MVDVGKREFIVSRRQFWEETENLLRRIRRHGMKSLNEEELLRLGTLYRQAAADLAKARAAEPFGDVTLYLNRLVANTHSVIYVNKSRPWENFLRFISADFPSLIRSQSKVVLFTALVFALSSILGYHWMNTDPDWMGRFVPMISQVIEQMAGKLESGPALLASGNISKESMPEVSSLIMVNNIRISAFAFASGITFGLGTAYLLITNGVMLGGVAYLYLARPVEYGIYFMAGILPHGVIELTAIVFSAAAGFILAGALIMPGSLRRVDALKYHSRSAIRIMYGVVIMLIIAALIEGFITPIKVDGNQQIVDYLKIGFSVVLGFLMIVYFSLAGRGRYSV